MRVQLFQLILAFATKIILEHAHPFQKLISFVNLSSCFNYLKLATLKELILSMASIVKCRPATIVEILQMHFCSPCRRSKIVWKNVSERESNRRNDFQFLF